MKRKIRILIIILAAVLVAVPVSNTFFYAGTPYPNRTLIATLPYLPLIFTHQVQRTVAQWRYSSQVSIARATDTAPPPIPTVIPLSQEVASRLPPDVVDALDVPVHRPFAQNKYGTPTDARSAELVSLGYAQTAKGVFVKANTTAAQVKVELTKDAKLVEKTESVNGKTVTVYSFE